MSHACLIVALSPEQITEHGSVEEAIQWNMAPFDEHEECFADGSRWDYWAVGGRFTGLFDPDYDPEKDPANIETCWLCQGTGKRRDMEVANGCNGCRGSGRKVKWRSDWVEHGNIAQRKELDHLADKLTAYAFLKNRTWYERDRMGWFAASTPTECELAADQRGEEYSGRCIHTCEQTGARIVSFDEHDNDRWKTLYWARFIRNLPTETTLVVVDYHV